MNAERANGVDPARSRGRTRPANGVSDNACQSGTQPSHHGSNGARAGAENSVDDACHSGTQPSCHGGNGARPSDAAPEANERDPMGRFARGNQGGPGNPFGRLMGMLRCALVWRIKPEAVEAIADVMGMHPSMD